MGRKKIDNPRKPFSIMLTQSEVDEIDAMASKLDLSRSQFMRNLLLMGLDDAKILNNIGIISAVSGSRSLFRKVRDKVIKSGEDSITLSDMIE